MRLSDEQMLDDANDVAAMIAEARNAPEQTNKTTKRVRFGHVEVLEFRRGYTSCAVPTVGGPPVGLVGAPTARYVVKIPQSLDAIEEEDAMPRGDINDVWICPVERARLLTQLYGFSLDDISLLCREARAIQDSRAVSRLDFDASHVLRSGNLSQLQLLYELRTANAAPTHTAPKKVMLFESSDRVGILA
jgi:hypothetical protein